jgi:hypothetical protein
MIYMRCHCHRPTARLQLNNAAADDDDDDNNNNNNNNVKCAVSRSRDGKF